MNNSLIYISSLLIGCYCSLYMTGCCFKDLKTNLSSKKENLLIANKVVGKPHIDFTDMPLFFIANKGQVNEKAKFYAKASQYTLWLTKKGIVFDVLRNREVDEELGKIRREISSLVFVNANPEPKIISDEDASLQVNYFIGNDRLKWNTNIPTSLAVLYKDLYQDIDLKVYGIEKQIEYDWIIGPDGEPSNIEVAYNAVKGTRIDDKGNLLVETNSGELIHKRPLAYQDIDNKRVLVSAEYKHIRERNYGFTVGNYNNNYPLVIDPVVLVYSTYLGGNNDDQGFSITSDSDGTVYVTGETISTDFPTKNHYQTVQAAKDIFVSKIDTTKNGMASLLYSTYLGGKSSDESGKAIAVDNSGNVFITGWSASSHDFPLLNHYQTCGNDYDVIVARIDTTKSGEDSLIYSTCLDGIDGDKGRAIAANDNGIVYITGDTNGGFPIRNQYQTCDDGSVFVTKIDTSKSGDQSLLYSTCLGGSSFYEQGYGIDLDSRGSVYITGVTESPDFPTLNQFQDYHGGLDAFVSKIDTTKSGIASLNYSTYLGGMASDYSRDVVTDDTGNVYVTGYTESSDFPLKNEYQKSVQGFDAFVTKIDTTKSGPASLIYSTYLGGAWGDFGEGITADDGGNAYIIGWTQSTDFPIKKEYQTNQGGEDVFVSRVDTTQNGITSLIYSTYLGGEADDRGMGISASSSDYVYLIGSTSSSDFPTKNQYQANQEGEDSFISKLSFIDYGPFKLSVSISGNGTVTSEPQGIHCPTDCTETYAKNTSVRLSAVASKGAIFGSWSGGKCKVRGTTCTVIMDRDQEVTASFGKKGGIPWSMLLLKNRE